MTSTTLEVSPRSIPGQQTSCEHAFPLVLQCETSGAAIEKMADWIGEHRDLLTQQAHAHGAVLFRGFPIRTAEDFDRFIAAFGFENFPYEESLSNAVRVNYTPRVFSANEAPSEVAIYLHHEMAQTPVFPSRLFFFCEQPAEEGGATPLCRSDLLLERMQEQVPNFVRDCEQKGLMYTNVMPREDDSRSGMGRSWQGTFRSQTREDVEQRLRELGYSWEWLPDGCLRATTPVLPAVREVGPGRKTFFNQLIAAFQGWKDSRNDPSKAICFGDGTPLDRDTILKVAGMADELTFDLAWEQGDVVLVDNLIVMHGRRSFRGRRKVLASLVTIARHAPV